MASSTICLMTMVAETVVNNLRQGIAVDFGTSDGVNRDVFEGPARRIVT